MSRNTNLASRANKISSMSKDVEFKEVKTPDPSVNFVDQFKDAASPRIDSSNEFIVNVLPNMVPIMCFILYNVAQTAPSLEASKHAKISAPSFAAYCFALVYGYILAADLYVRPTASAHATPYAESDFRKNFLEFLLSLPVPDFLVPLFTQISPGQDETRKNVSFCPSAAGFSYTTHFGRFIPLIMFTAIHDIVAETPSNTSRNEITHLLMTTALYQLTTLVDTRTNVTVQIGNILGSGFTATNPASTNAHYYSKVYQIFTSVFNPVIFRDYQRRSVLASIALDPITYPTRHMNFYDLVFSASRSNLAELRTVFTSISASINGNVKCSGDLASQFKNISGLQIFSHGYSEYALPTWHHGPITSTNIAPRRLTPVQFASAIGFLQAPTIGRKATAGQPIGRCDTDRNHPVTASFNSIFNLQRTVATTTDTPNPTTGFLNFNEDTNLYPKVRVLSPFEQSTVDAWKVTAFGMVIESFEIDGTVIPTPNVQIPLGTDNSWFADSAIPYRYTIWTLYNVNPTIESITVRPRVNPPRQTRFPAASLLLDRTTVNLGRPATQFVGSTSPANYFAGLTFVDNVTWYRKFQSFLGFRTADNRDHAATSDEILGMQTGSLTVWSPYTYTPYESAADYTYTFAENRSYYLTNLRSLFGTRVRLIEVNNGIECMPVP